MGSSSGSVKGKDFPTTVYGHCAIKINSTHGLVIGGKQDGSYSASTWFVDLTTTTFTPGPPMKIKRMYHGCTTFNLGTKTFGIVGGGLNNGKEVRLDSTEIIDLDQNHPPWTEGPNLPRRLNYVTLVETTQGTFAIGGRGNDMKYRAEVLKLECPGDQIQSCQWQEMKEKLEVPRGEHVSFSLPESYDIFSCRYYQQ